MIIELSIELLEEFHHLGKWNHLLRSHAGRDSSITLKGKDSRASRRYGSLKFHRNVIIVGYRQDEIFSLLHFLPRIAEINLVPDILVSLQMQTILLPMVPIKRNSRRTSFQIRSIHIQCHKNILITGQLHVELSDICINEFACFRQYASRNSQRERELFRHLNLSIGRDSIFATYRNTSGEGSCLCAQVSE